MHMTLVPKVRPKPSLPHYFTPSRGKSGTWAWIVDRYYIRLGGGFRGLSKNASQDLRAKLESRNRTVRMVRRVLLAVVSVACAVVAWKLTH